MQLEMTFLRAVLYSRRKVIDLELIRPKT